MADRFWRGGTAAWDGTAGTKWAATVGGAGGASVPTSADDVFFDATSGAVTCTISTGNTGAKSITCTGFTGTLAGTAAISVAGSITLVAGMTFSYTGTITITATATVTSASKTLGSITINGTGITVTLADAMTTGITNTTTLTRGTLALADFTLSTGIFSSSNSNTRAISFGAGNIALTSSTAGATVLSMATATGFTFTGTGGFTRSNTNSTTMQFGSTAGGSTTNAPNLTVNAGSSSLTITSGSYFKNVIFTGNGSTVTAAALNMAGDLTLASGGTYTSFNVTFRAPATITSVGKTIQSAGIDAAGSTVTLNGALTQDATYYFTLTSGTLDLSDFTLSAGGFSSNNSNTRSIYFGTGNIALTATLASTSVLVMANATNFSWTGTGGFTRGNFINDGARVAFGTTGGTTSNAPDLTVNAGSRGFIIDSGSWFKNLNFTGSTSFITASNLNMAGNLTLASGGTYTSVGPTFRASATVTSNGKTLNNTTVNGSGITVTLADAMTLGSANTLTLTEGTFTAANFNVTAGSFSSSNSNTRTLNMGSGTWTISGSGATAWNTATTTGLTVAPSTSTITMTSASAKTFAGGGLTYYNLNQGGAGALTITGSNTFNDITDTVQPSTVTFTAGTTQTVSNFSLAGTAGNLITINSATPGSQFTLSKASGTVNAQYLAIQDSNATGGATWNSLFTSGNVNNGNNTGWRFSLASGNMFMLFN
jgi:hypothetical protein